MLPLDVSVKHRLVTDRHMTTACRASMASRGKNEKVDYQTYKTTQRKWKNHTAG